MRFKITQLPKHAHTQMVTALGWAPNNELFTCGDEKKILKWSLDGENTGSVCDVDSFITDFKWYSSLASKGGVGGGDVFVIGCSDGTFRLMGRSGRVDKTVEAHTGAITGLSWNYEGTALLTSGEDGLIKQWSQAGNFRSKLASSERAIYGVCWSPDNQSVLFCSDRYISIKSIQVSSKAVKWKAHDGTVLKVDWNPINGFIISGGEDCKYKVWDSFGRLLYSSKASEFPVTSVSWSPNGDYFAVGSFNMIMLCDRTGWTCSRSSTQSGSILSIDWTSDGTHIAGAGANGAVCFGQVVDRSVEWGSYQCMLNEHNQVVVLDLTTDATEAFEELEFPQRVTDMAMGFGHLVVATAKSCYIYSPKQGFSTPNIFDLNGTVTLILISQSHFLLVDNVKGMQVVSFEGRIFCNPRLASIRSEYLKQGNVALSSDCLVVIDRANPNTIHILDAHSGKPVREAIKHDLEVQWVGLNQNGLISDRKLVYIDANRDMFICQIMSPAAVAPSERVAAIKIGVMVDTAIWSETNEMMAAISDSKLLIWAYPNAVFVDRDLVKLTCISTDATQYGKGAQLSAFSGTRITIRRADGALVSASVSPFPEKLQIYSQQNQWARCTRLCRASHDDMLWACLATMAIFHQQLDTAEVALAAIDEVDKLQYIQAIKAIPSVEGRNAELFLFRRMPDEAERLLIQANLVYRAIALDIKIFRWERALDLAIKYKTHVDTVLAYRQKYLNSLKRAEIIPKFIEYNKELTFDWTTVRNKELQELEKEAARGTPYVSSFVAQAVDDVPDFDVSPVPEAKYNRYTPSAPAPQPEIKQPEYIAPTPAPAPVVSDNTDIGSDALPAGGRRGGRGRAVVAEEPINTGETVVEAPGPSVGRRGRGRAVVSEVDDNIVDLG